MKNPNPFFYVWSNQFEKYLPCWNPMSGFAGGLLCALYLIIPFILFIDWLVRKT